jgi:RNA polymerase sigma-70 factor (ECF subfamily)
MKTFFEEHIWPQRSKLYRLAFSWVKDRALAEDVLHNVFEKSFTRQKELVVHANLSGWLILSLKNEVLTHFRQNKKIDTLEDTNQLRADESQPEDVTESIQKVMSLLKELPEKQRDIFQLREVEGLDYSEIAAHLDISLDQVKVNLYRARKRIRELMINQKFAK